jgi:hypothetical protein
MPLPDRMSTEPEPLGATALSEEDLASWTEEVLDKTAAWNPRAPSTEVQMSMIAWDQAVADFCKLEDPAVEFLLLEHGSGASAQLLVDGTNKATVIVHEWTIRSISGAMERAFGFKTNSSDSRIGDAKNKLLRWATHARIAVVPPEVGDLDHLQPFLCNDDTLPGLEALGEAVRTFVHDEDLVALEASKADTSTVWNILLCVMRWI